MSEETASFPAAPGELDEVEPKVYFKSLKRPKERGVVVLTEEGMVEVRPSEEFVEELARLEEKAVENSLGRGVRAGQVVMLIGFLIAAAGWLAGRSGGKLRERMTKPRPVDDLKMYGDVTGGFHLTLPGKLGSTIELNWGQGEVNPREVGAFLRACRKWRTKDGKPYFR